jgi:hypothetical protein
LLSPDFLSPDSLSPDFAVIAFCCHSILLSPPQ